MTSILLPRQLGSREHATRLTTGMPETDRVTLDARPAVLMSQGAADQLVKELLNKRVRRIVVVGGTPSLQNRLRQAHRRRSQTVRHVTVLTFAKD